MSDFLFPLSRSQIVGRLVKSSMFRILFVKLIGFCCCICACRDKKTHTGSAKERNKTQVDVCLFVWCNNFHVKGIPKPVNAE